MQIWFRCSWERKRGASAGRNSSPPLGSGSMKVQSESLIIARLHVTECFMFFSLWLTLGCNITNWHWYQTVCLSLQWFDHIRTQFFLIYSVCFIACFGCDITKYVLAWFCMYTLCVIASFFPFSWPVFLPNQYSAVEAHGLQDVNPHRTSQCVFLCVSVWGWMVMCTGLHALVVTALLSIRSPFCVEMIQCGSFGSYWSQWTEERRSKTESSCNMLRHLLDMRNKGFEVTDSCQCSS